MVLNIRKASVHWWIVIGDLFEAACCSSILPACTIIQKGFSPELGNKLFLSTNSLFQIFSLSFEETDAPRGTQSDKWICELLGHAKYYYSGINCLQAHMWTPYPIKSKCRGRNCCSSRCWFPKYWCSILNRILHYRLYTCFYLWTISYILLSSYREQSFKNKKQKMKTFFSFLVKLKLRIKK